VDGFLDKSCPRYLNTLQKIAGCMYQINAGRRRSELEVTIPKRASATAASLLGRSRANNRRGGGGGKARNTGVRERNLSVTIARNQCNQTVQGSICVCSARGETSMCRRLQPHTWEGVVVNADVSSSNPPGMAAFKILTVTNLNSPVCLKRPFLPTELAKFLFASSSSSSFQFSVPTASMVILRFPSHAPGFLPFLSPLLLLNV
jgi:hypothetical protein